MRKSPYNLPTLLNYAITFLQPLDINPPLNSHTVVVLTWYLCQLYRIDFPTLVSDYCNSETEDGRCQYSKGLAYNRTGGGDSLYGD